MDRISKKEYQERLNSLFPDESILLLKYTKASAPCTYKCLKCNNEYTIYRAGDLQRKKHICNFCWYCAGQGKKTKNQKEKALQIIEEDGDKKFLEFGYNKKIYKPTIKFKCLKCGENAELALVYFINKHSCPHCSYQARHLTTSGVQMRFPEDYEMLEEYRGTDKKVLVRHKSCGFIWKVTPHEILSGYGCPKCNKRNSKGEQKIIKFLQEKNIDFEKEKIFDWCGKRRYDFYLPGYNLVIEYMGQQHYFETNFFKTPLKEQKKIDKYKKDQALLHNLYYLEISYKDFDNIETILAQRLSLVE